LLGIIFEASVVVKILIGVAGYYFHTFATINP
jgi:hypothetical protein